MFTPEQAKIVDELTAHFRFVTRRKELVTPTFVWREMSRALGVAEFKTNTIYLHPALSKDISVFRNTVAHELAHFVEYHFYNKTSHGATWRRCAILMGAEPRACTVTNIVEVKSRKKRRYKYNVAGKDIFLTKKYHNDITKGTVLRLKDCHTKITYFDFVEEVLI